MSGEFKLIRDAVKQRVETVFAGKVFKSRLVDPRDVDEYVKVFLSRGRVRSQGVLSKISSDLVISYHHKILDDDDGLDLVMDAVHAAMVASPVLPELLQGVHFEGFDYFDEEEGQYSGLQYVYNVIY